MSFTYGQRPGDLLILMTLGILLWAWLSARLGERRVWRLGNLALLLAAVWAIVHATLLWSREAGERRALLEPFQTLRLAKLYPELYREMFMNILLFFPLGLTLPQVLSRGSRAQRLALTVLLGVALSLLVEGGQYYWGLGVAETDDVLCNTLGTLVGTLSLPLQKLFRKEKRGS